MEPRENILEKLKAAPDALLLMEELQKSIAPSQGLCPHRPLLPTFYAQDKYKKLC